MVELSGADILGAEDLPVLELEVPEWNGKVFIRTLQGHERDEFEGRAEKDYRTNIRARMAAAVLCDRTGRRLFTEADEEELGKRSARALDRVFDAACKHNRIGRKAIAELEKKSAEAPGSGSHLDLPEARDAPGESSSRA